MAEPDRHCILFLVLMILLGLTIPVVAELDLS
jgi:hypothetical protein